MRGRGGWPAPGAQSISWRRLRVDNAAGVAANGALLFRADFGPAVMLSALPVFWRSLAGKSFGISSVRLRTCSNCARPLISANRPGSRLPADIGRGDWPVLDRSFAWLE